MPTITPRPGTPLAEELRKWEQHHTQYSIDENGESRPGNPYVYREYPKMLYKAQVWHRSGKAVTGAPQPKPYDFLGMPNLEQAYALACEEAERFTASCQRIVNDETEERIAYGQGWCDGQQVALERYTHEQEELSTLAANAAHHAARMSEKAQAEFEAAQNATDKHVADVAAPKRSPGRPRRVAAQE